MKEPAVQSPFAALNSKEQKEQWIWWQSQHPADTTVREDIDPVLNTELPALKLPGQEAKTVNRQPPIRYHHGQYDAVVRRMNAARRQAAAYMPWSDGLLMTSAPSSGSEKAEK